MAKVTHFVADTLIMAPDMNELGLMIVSCEMLIAKLFSVLASASPSMRQDIFEYLKETIDSYQKQGFAPATWEPYETVLAYLELGQKSAEIIPISGNDSDKK